MIEYLTYRIQLKKLNKALSKLHNEAALVEASYKPGEDDQGHISHIHHQCHQLEQWIELHKTTYLKNKADSLLIPMPSIQDTTIYKEFDFGDEDGPKKILKAHGIYQVRELIRNEQKAKREIVGFWFSIITGLIGAIIGLISIIKS